MKRYVVVFIVIAMALTFGACGAQKKLLGKWQTEVNIESYEVPITFEFDEGGEGKLTISIWGYEESNAFKYSVSGSKLTIKTDDDEYTVEFSISGDELTLTSDEFVSDFGDDVLVFARVDG